MRFSLSIFDLCDEFCIVVFL